MARGIRFRPEQKGLRVALFDLEADIMDTIWSKGWDSFSVGDVHKILQQSRKIAYTTVMNTIVRLHEKELLAREKDGRRYVYRPTMSRSEFDQSMARDILGRLTEDGRDVAMALLIERVDSADEEGLARLEAMIQARRKELDS